MQCYEVSTYQNLSAWYVRCLQHQDRRRYKIFRTEAADKEGEVALQISFERYYSLVRPGGLVPQLLINAALQRLALLLNMSNL